MDGRRGDQFDDQLHAAATGVATENKMLKKWLWIILTAGGLLAAAQAQDSQTQATASPEEVAGECQVSLVETAHLTIDRKRVSRDNDKIEPSCAIHFISKEKVTNEMIGFIFSPRRMDLDNEYAAGFERSPDKPDQWLFEGRKDVLYKSRFLKRSFTHAKEGDDDLLVGHQLVHGYSVQGGLFDLPGIHILRLTPQFAISVELNFSPMSDELSVEAYKQRLDTYSRELVEIVKSIQPTPGQSGPTIRTQP